MSGGGGRAAGRSLLHCDRVPPPAAVLHDVPGVRVPVTEPRDRAAPAVDLGVGRDRHRQVGRTAQPGLPVGAAAEGLPATNVAGTDVRCEGDLAPGNLLGHARGWGGLGGVGGLLRPLGGAVEDDPTDHDRQDQPDRARRGTGRASAPGGGDPRAHPVEPGVRSALDARGPLAERVEVLGDHDRLLSSGTGASAVSARSFASALADWLFTVLTEQPSRSAVSTSVRSSRKRSTTTAR